MMHFLQRILLLRMKEKEFPYCGRKHFTLSEITYFPRKYILTIKIKYEIRFAHALNFKIPINFKKTVKYRTALQSHTGKNSREYLLFATFLF